MNEIENTDVETAARMLAVKLGKELPDGSKGPTSADIHFLEEVQFFGGFDAWYAAKEHGSPGCSPDQKRGALLWKARGLILQNPPRKIRRWANLPHQ